MSRTLSLLRWQPQRLLLLAALAALLAGFALATQNASAQTIETQVHWVRVDCDTPATIMQPNDAGKYAYAMGDDLCVQLWVVNAAQTAGAVPAAGSFPTYGDFEWLVLGLRNDDPSVAGAGAINNRNGAFQIGVGPTSGAHSYGFQTEDAQGMYQDFSCPARWGSGSGFGLPCGAGNTFAAKASLLEHTGVTANSDTVKAAGTVYKLVVPSATLSGRGFFVSGRLRTLGLPANVERENALEFVNSAFSEARATRLTNFGAAGSEDNERGSTIRACTTADNTDTTTKVDCADDVTPGTAVAIGHALYAADDSLKTPGMNDYVTVSTSDGWIVSNLCDGGLPVKSCTYDADALSASGQGSSGGVFFLPNTGASEIAIAYKTQVGDIRDGDDTVIDDTTLTITGGTAGALAGKVSVYPRDNAFTLRIGAELMDTSPPDFPGSDSLFDPAGNGYIAGIPNNAIFEVKLEADSGTITVLSTPDMTCDPVPTADAPTCTVTLDDGDLARAGGAWAYRATPAATDQILPLRFTYDGTADKIDITITPSGTGADVDASITFGSTASVAGVRAYLSDDADNILGPGQTAEVKAGVEIATSEEWLAAAFGRFQFLGGGRARAAADAIESGYLVLTGPAAWEDGSTRLSLNAGNTYDNIYCVPTRSLAGSEASPGDTCWVSDAMGNAPKFTVAGDADEDISLTVSINSTRTITAVSDDRGEALSAPTVTGGIYNFGYPGGIGVDGPWVRENLKTGTERNVALTKTFFGRATLRVGEVAQIDSVALGRKPVGGVTPSGTIPVGQTTREDLVLSIRNADNAPTQETALSAITLSVIGGGRIASAFCPGGINAELTTCTVNLATSAGNTVGNSLRLAARANPAVIGGIPINFKAPTTAGTSRIVATVIGGNGQTYSADPLELVVSGTASSVAVTGDMPRLLSFGTPDSGDAKDDRDVATIKISASDAGGNAAAMPSNATASLKRADGTAVSSSAAVATVECSNPERTNCNLVINVNQSANSPLDSGSYVATVEGRGITALEVPLTLAGKAKTVNVALGELPGLGGNWTVNITVLDANGVPVADGTELRLNARGVAAATSDVVLISKPNEGSDGVAIAKTKNGMYSATLTVIARGRGVLSVSAVSGSGDSLVTDASDPGVVLDTRMAAVPGEAYGGPVEFQSADGMPALGVIARWRSTTPGSAADALALVPEAEVLWLHNGRRWIQYATGEDGAALPGANNFVVTNGDFLWYGASQ